MASRPRPSLLALFDPLAVPSEPSPSTPNVSPDSGSDKENTNTNTPKCTRAKAFDDACSETLFFKRTHSKIEQGEERSLNLDAQACSNLLGDSVSIAPKDDSDDASNLCLVQLADELDSACKISAADDFQTVSRTDGPREPLSEISIVPSNSRSQTPQSVARGKRLINFDTPTTTPRSARKLAAGILKLDPSTPAASSPLASRAARTPRNLLSPQANSPSITLFTPHNVAPYNTASPAPSLPFATNSPGLLTSTPTSDSTSSAFQDPPSGLRSSSFDIQNTLGMKKMDLSGDLLNDDLSFLARLEEDSFADFARGDSSGSTAGPSPKTPKDGTTDSMKKKPDLTPPSDDAKIDEVQHAPKVITPVRKTSIAFRRSSLRVRSDLGSGIEENLSGLASPICLQPRTPSSSPPFVEGEKGGHAFAPKKSVAVLRRNSSLSRSSIGIPDRPKVHLDKGSESSASKAELVRRPRPSSAEIKPQARSRSLAAKKAETSIRDSSPVGPPPSVRRSSISVPRPSIGRRASVSAVLEQSLSKSSKGSDSMASQGQAPKIAQGEKIQGARRPSISSSAKATPVKTNSFATTGRMGGARRVPLTANAPLFKVVDSTIIESPGKSPVVASRPTTKTGPQRPVASAVPASLGRGTAGLGSVPSSATSTRTLGRSTFTSTASSNRGSFMTSSGSSTSRLLMPSSKATSKIPGPGSRKAF